MTNPTSNYGFVLPTSTDLVTDLPADFDVALQGVDTRLKALQPGTTPGDLAYSSATANTNTRLGIGTTGQILTVTGGVPAWGAAPSSGSMTLISTSTLNTTSLTLSSIPQTYNTLYLIMFGMTGATADRTVRVGPNGSFSNCSFSGVQDGSTTNNLDCSIDLANQGDFLRTSSDNAFVITINNYTSSTGRKLFQFNGRYINQASTVKINSGFGAINTTTEITSIVIDRGGTNSFSTGTVLFYGVK